CEYYPEFEKVKIFYPDIAPKGYFTLDEIGNYYCANTGYFIVNNQKYLLGILNSRLITFYYSQLAALLRGGYLRFFTQDLAKIPIRTINFSDPADKSRHDRMVQLVTIMLDLNKKLQDARVDHDKTLLQRQIEATDGAIDALVYELYGLTAEEIKIVEGRL
ncbi:TaqI-like C-terminal specificity domain-containing protein, partial [Methanoregula sp.]|uniref:TaqI-like C-terminal specificity domain-containing protein n=1 Tax=Methanoregula sp. TaxID=2052170 RepID=UPI000CAB46F1